MERAEIVAELDRMVRGCLEHAADFERRAELAWFAGTRKRHEESAKQFRRGAEVLGCAADEIRLNNVPFGLGGGRG